ncbi:pyrimidine 5'-nucleotidase [Paracoccus suum]|uniref:Pyrimidine 5'-nucleotidase n=1 Tax=Paracoccus suum TaxID=2259340 RepID=A0A344PKQ4_9RHOB|nr:pyrimidine 5'-nucleotidase [Paracoccus suum]AXC49959.1 pyrimidine 5'-nucleotidase [Paracoccus suum]
MDFAHVTTWVFDLDNTLYDPEAQLFAQIEQRMSAYVTRELGVAAPEAARLRDHWWRAHGTTLKGLMDNHGIDPLPYLAEVHDIDFSVLTPDPDLSAAIAALPGRKIVHTNADADYAVKVLRHRGIDAFDAVYGIAETGFHPKPDARAFAAVIAIDGFDPARAAFFEDDPRNLLEPHALGMQTVLVGAGRHGPDLLADDHDHGVHVGHRTRDLIGFLRALVPAQPGVAD